MTAKTIRGREDGGGRPEGEEKLCLVGPGGRERVTFYRRSDGLWHYRIETFAEEEHRVLGYIPGHWYPLQFSGLHDSLATARREAAGGRRWVGEGGGG